MGPNLTNLLESSGPAICGESPRVEWDSKVNALGIGRHLSELLAMKNGFYAFEGALHLLHSGCQIAQPDLEKWNADDCWKGRYDGAADGYVFFAEDIFGEQFALCNERVYRFDPETARVEEMADDLERWASLILERSDYETGYPMARAWQQRHGRLLPGQRLLPKTLFILGGAYDLSNLYAIDAVKGMRFRADVWRQLRSLAPGTKVNLRIEE